MYEEEGKRIGKRGFVLKREILLDVQKPSLEGTKLVSDTDFVCTNILRQRTNR